MDLFKMVGVRQQPCCVAFFLPSGWNLDKVQTMESFIAALPFDLRYLWLIAGATFLALEAAGVVGVGLVFGGLAAFIVGILIEFNVLSEHDLTIQLAIWFLATVILAFVMFRPLKKWRTNPESEDKFDNIIGTTAVVAPGGLMVGKPGRVHWSGTMMNAQVAPDSYAQAFLEGDHVTVVAIKGNQLVVASSHASTEPLMQDTSL
jgi:membrane protein implicated in regulation of membrane protease activity